MATKLGRKLAELDPAGLQNPVLARLVLELRGDRCIRTGGFNDTGRTHSDLINNDTDKHTDIAKESFSCGRDDRDIHTDLSYRDGRQYSHSDDTDCCDNHTDSDPNHQWRWSYSDMTR